MIPIIRKFHINIGFILEMEVVMILLHGNNSRIYILQRWKPLVKKGINAMKTELESWVTSVTTVAVGLALLCFAAGIFVGKAFF